MRLNHIAEVLRQSASPKDWPEDFAHENGYYFCDCVTCGYVFKGHKRRVQCKECSQLSHKEP